MDGGQCQRWCRGPQQPALQAAHLEQQSLGIAGGKPLAAGDAGMEKQGGLFGGHIQVHHQACLAPQPQQPGFAGAAIGCQRPQLGILQRS